MRYYLFPHSFLAVGSAGIFVTYIIALSRSATKTPNITLWFIGIVVELLPFAIAIIFKNELLVGESFLFLVLYGMLPIFSQYNIVGEFSSYLYAGLLFLFIALSYILAKMKLTAAPSVISLLAFPIFVFVPTVHELTRL